ncbi:hypothetical protein BDV10DRAFT_160780 [Aspergillus recurvatus]
MQQRFRFTLGCSTLLQTTGTGIPCPPGCPSRGHSQSCSVTCWKLEQSSVPLASTTATVRIASTFSLRVTLP